MSGGIVGDFKLIPGGEVPAVLTVDAVRRHIEEHDHLVVVVTISAESLEDYLVGKADWLARAAWAVGVETESEMESLVEAWQERLEANDARNN